MGVMGIVAVSAMADESIGYYIVLNYRDTNEYIQMFWREVK